MTTKFLLVAGARPNFIKIAPLAVAFRAAISDGWDAEFRLVHTGQHTMPTCPMSFSVN